MYCVRTVECKKNHCVKILFDLSANVYTRTHVVKKYLTRRIVRLFFNDADIALRPVAFEHYCVFGRVVSVFAKSVFLLLLVLICNVHGVPTVTRPTNR